MTSSYGKRLCPIWKETLSYMERDFVLMERDFVLMERDFARSNRIKILFFCIT